MITTVSNEVPAVIFEFLFNLATLYQMFHFPSTLIIIHVLNTYVNAIVHILHVFFQKGGVVICQGIDDADNQDVMRWYSCLIITVLSIMNMKQST